MYESILGKELKKSNKYLFVTKCKDEFKIG